MQHSADKRLEQQKKIANTYLEQIQALNVSKTHLENQITDYRAQIIEMQSTNAALTEQLQLVQDELKQSIDNHQKDVEALEEDILQLETMYNESQGKFDELMRIKVSLSLEIDQYRKLLEQEERRVGIDQSPAVSRRPSNARKLVGRSSLAKAQNKMDDEEEEEQQQVVAPQTKLRKKALLQQQQEIITTTTSTTTTGNSMNDNEEQEIATTRTNPTPKKTRQTTTGTTTSASTAAAATTTTTTGNLIDPQEALVITNTSLSGEYIKLRNCSTVPLSLQNYTIESDLTGNAYKFDAKSQNAKYSLADITLGPNEQLMVYFKKPTRKSASSKAGAKTVVDLVQTKLFDFDDAEDHKGQIYDHLHRSVAKIEFAKSKK
eukprot:UN02987